MSGSNIVRMPSTALQAPAPAPSPMAYPWPMPPPGCCPPGGMDALMQCYCDIQAAKNFIGKIVLDLMQTDPAFAQAMVQAIADSGAALPLVGVTNGSDAQPGQVGEFVIMNQIVAFPTTAVFSQSVTMGVLQPGDWDCWMFVGQSVLTNGMYLHSNPTPPGFSDDLAQEVAGPTMGSATVMLTATVQASISVPSLIALTLITNTESAGSAAGNAYVNFRARRRR